MLKKIISAGLLTGFIGILIWGGVNRTLAKTDPSEGRNTNNQNAEHVEYTEGNGVQQRGNGNQGQENDNHDEMEAAESLAHIAEQSTTQSQGGNNGNGFQLDTILSEAAAPAEGTGSGNRDGRGNGQGGGSDPLTDTEIEALNLALDDEYHALAVYQAVIATFGDVEPFVEVSASEQRHIEALLNQFNKHGLAIPENPWTGNIPAFESVQHACQAGVAAEIANADLYNQLFGMTDDPSLTRIFANLSNASLNSHLPQFEACQ